MSKPRIVYPRQRLYKVRRRMAVELFMAGLRGCFKIGFKWGSEPGTKERAFDEVAMLGRTIVHVQWDEYDHEPSAEAVELLNDVAEYFLQEKNNTEQ